MSCASASRQAEAEPCDASGGRSRLALSLERTPLRLCGGAIRDKPASQSMEGFSFRPLSMKDAPEVLRVMRKAAGGLSRQPHEMDLAWAEEALATALSGGVAIGAWEGVNLAGVIKA